MVFQEPSVEFIQILETDICASTGAGYTICQKLTGSNVGCASYANGTYPSVSVADLCGSGWCTNPGDDAEALSYEAFNN